jgi:hypothetical protein
MIDGRLVDQRAFAYFVSPDGRFAINDDVNTVGCIDSPQQLRLIDLMTGRDAVVVEQPARGIRFNSWSPRGDELLYDEYDTYQLGDSDCAPGLVQASRKTFLVPAVNREPVEVDGSAARKRWYGGHDVDVVCTAAFEAWGECSGDVSLTVDGTQVGASRDITIIDVIPR